MTSILALDLGGTKFSGGLVSPGGKILFRCRAELEGKKGRGVGKLIENQLAALLASAASRKISVGGVGIAVPGIANSKTGRVWAPNIPGWENYPLKTQVDGFLRRHFHQSRTIPPVAIESDRVCYIFGEAWLGAAKGCADAIFLSVGTGIGAGILVNGQVLRGFGDIAGAIGWMAMNRPFQTNYEPCGCLEYHASGAGLDKAARTLVLPSPTSAQVFAAFKKGNPVAKKILREAIEYWGMAVANLVSLFNPQIIVFGGGVFGPAIQFLPQIRAEATKWAQPIAMRQVKLKASALGGDAGLYGAAYSALRSAKLRE